MQPIARVAASTFGELHGTVEDEKGRPLAGAIVSALGASTVFAVSDSEGRFAFRNLAIGPYLVRVHLQGYVPARGRVIQVSASGHSTYTFALARSTDDPAEPPTILTAGVGGGGATTPSEAEHDHDELAWRLRHAKRSVLKDADQAIAGIEDKSSVMGDLGRAVGTPARLASSLFSDLPLNGQINLLTTTSFDRPQDLFSMSVDAPRGVAYMSLVAPGDNGEWLMRGTVTQGDLSSWIVSGSYRRAPEATHAYEAGVSYSMQRYIGGNGEALLAMRDGSRNVGAMYAFDNWSAGSRVRLGYGAQYARYDYLPRAGLMSPRASVTIQPLAHDALKVRAAVSHRETAPGAEEFTPPSVGLWLPPERTFSQVSRSAFRPETLDHVEVAAEREWPGMVVVGVRAFQQRVDDQVVTLFGVGVTDPGHYRVGSAGDFTAHGWGVSISRAMAEGVRASLDYTQVQSNWIGQSPDAIAIAALAAALPGSERLHDMTATVESLVSPTATRLFVIYKVNSGFAGTDDGVAASLANARFNVQVNQSLPFLKFSSSSWEMLVAVSNLFRDDVIDGSVYDEQLVVRPPKRVLGGVTVRF